MERRIGWPAGAVALGLLTLIGMMFWRATEDMTNFDKIWAVAGPIVGVVVGAIPGFFFAHGAKQGETEARTRAEAYASALPEDQRSTAMDILRELKETQKQDAQTTV